MIVAQMTIQGADGTSNSTDNQTPKTTEKAPMNIAIIDMPLGEFATCLAVAAGMIINDISNSTPIN